MASFAVGYRERCIAQNTCPLKRLTTHLDRDTLAFNGDRLSPADWKPVLDLLQGDRSLQRIAITSTWIQQERERVKASPRNPYGRTIASYTARTPPILTADHTHALARSLRDCLSLTKRLVSIELVGIPLRPRDLGVLCIGLEQNTSLLHLSLRKCHIGDDGCQAISRGLQVCSSLIAVDLSCNELGPASGNAVADIIEAHATRRHGQAWSQSLRRQQPDVASMDGLRCLNLSGNRGFGDRGAKTVCHSLKDDLWVLEVNLAQCGLTNAGAKHVTEVLRRNTNLLAFDVAKNKIGELQRGDIHDLLSSNSAASGAELAAARLLWRKRLPSLKEASSFAVAMSKTRRPASARKSKKARGKKKKAQDRAPTEGQLEEVHTDPAASTSVDGGRARRDGSSASLDLNLDHLRALRTELEHERLLRQQLAEENDDLRSRLSSSAASSAIVPAAPQAAALEAVHADQAPGPFQSSVSSASRFGGRGEGDDDQWATFDHAQLREIESCFENLHRFLDQLQEQAA